MNRRDFLAASLALPAFGAFGKLSAFTKAEPAFKISLAQWSLNKGFFGRAKDGVKLDPIDFPKIAKTDYGIEAVEYVNQFYKDKKNDEKYLAELRKRCDDQGVKSVLIMCDGEGALGDADEAKRKKAVENHVRWIEWAKALGCHSIRVNAQSSGSYEEQMDRAADGLRQLCVIGDKYDINVIVENHGGLSSNGAWLAATIKKVDHKRAGTLPDFGNFRVNAKEEYDRYKGVAELMPFAKGVSAKCYDFNAEGNETKMDYAKLMKIVLAAGYKGHVGIEYEGSRLSDAEGIKACKKLLERLQTA